MTPAERHLRKLWEVMAWALDQSREIDDRQDFGADADGLAATAVRLQGEHAKELLDLGRYLALRELQDLMERAHPDEKTATIVVDADVELLEAALTRDEFQESFNQVLDMVARSAEISAEIRRGIEGADVADGWFDELAEWKAGRPIVGQRHGKLSAIDELRTAAARRYERLFRELHFHGAEGLATLMARIDGQEPASGPLGPPDGESPPEPS